MDFDRGGGKGGGDDLSKGWEGSRRARRVWRLRGWTAKVQDFGAGLCVPVSGAGVLFGG